MIVILSGAFKDDSHTTSTPLKAIVCELLYVVPFIVRLSLPQLIIIVAFPVNVYGLVTLVPFTVALTFLPLGNVNV